MATFFRVVGVLFLSLAAFVFVTWGMAIVCIGPQDLSIYGPNVYFIPSATGFISALCTWWWAK